MFGDPHIFTLDGANFTFNGLGDFLLVRAQDSNSSFLLQGRTAQTGSANATNFISFAAQYNASGLAPITVSLGTPRMSLYPVSPGQPLSDPWPVDTEAQEEEEYKEGRGREHTSCQQSLWSKAQGLCSTW